MNASQSAIDLAQVAATAASDKLGQDIVAFDVSDALAITDIFLIISANNDRQVAAIVDAIEEALIVQRDQRPTRREGDRDNRWVLLDYVDLVIHVQQTQERVLYSLERLWKDCPRIRLNAIDDVLGQV